MQHAASRFIVHSLGCHVWERSVPVHERAAGCERGMRQTQPNDTQRVHHTGHGGTGKGASQMSSAGAQGDGRTAYPAGQGFRTPPREQTELTMCVAYRWRVRQGADAARRAPCVRPGCRRMHPGRTA